MSRDRRVDVYIAHARPFARPVLEHLRALVHQTCPDVVETIKWGMPAFEYKGLLCGMGAFQEHCTFTFWKAPLIPGLETGPGRPAMGHVGRVTSIKDLPPKRVFVGWLRAGMELNAAGVTVASVRPAKKKPPLRTPPDLAAALAKNKKAQATWDGFTTPRRREYVEWLSEAKRTGTRDARLAQAVAWLAEGKPLHAKSATAR